jgi:hypothetical protein
MTAREFQFSYYSQRGLLRDYQDDLEGILGVIPEDPNLVGVFIYTILTHRNSVPYKNRIIDYEMVVHSWVIKVAPEIEDGTY